MTSVIHTKRRAAAVAAAVLALAGAAGSVFGQSAPEPGKKAPKHEEFSKPLGKGANAEPGRRATQTHLSETDGDDRYELTIRGDEISAKINGKKVPADRIRREDDTVQILNEDGDVVKEFSVGGLGGAVTTMGPRGEAFRWLGGGDQPGAQVHVMPAPKVMIGITMSEPDEKAAERAGLKAGEGIMIADIIDGLPAEEAGLKKGDIILSIDGSDGELDQAKFRELINQKDPGDKVELTVSRKGDKKTFEVELKAWDPEKLGMAAPMALEGVPGFPGAEGLSREQLDEARKHLEGAMKQRYRMRQGVPGRPAEPPGADGRRDPGAGPDVWAGPGDHGEWKEFLFGNGENPEGMQFFMQPFQDRTEELNRRMDELQAKLDSLNEKLDRIAETLDRVNGKK